MKIKINDKYYSSAKIRYYNNLKTKLEIILASNKTPCEFYGIHQNEELGILVCGTDSMGIRPFERFYSIRDIHYYFDKHIKLLKKHGERRLSDI